MRTLFLLVLLYPLLGSAQDYIPMLQEGNTWSVEVGNDFGSETYFQYWLSGNEVINDIEYKVLFRDSESSLCRLREENGKIYRLNYDQTESILIDFTLDIGDRLIINTASNPCPSRLILIPDWYQVENVYYEYIAGVERKVLQIYPYVSDVSLPNRVEYWIEGIGSTRSFLTGYFGYDNLATWVYLNCFTQNDTTYYFNDADFCGENLGTDEKVEVETYIYPNPVTNTSILQFPESLGADTLLIYDIIGKLVSEIKVDSNTHIINHMNYRSGLYFYKLVGTHEVLVSNKFIIK